MSDRKRAEPGAGKTRISFDRSKVAGEFLRVSIRRFDRDDRLTWRLHFATRQATELAMWLMGNLPPAVVLRIIAMAVEHRPEVRAVMEAARRIDSDENSSDGSQG